MLAGHGHGRSCIDSVLECHFRAEVAKVEAIRQRGCWQELFSDFVGSLEAALSPDSVAGPVWLHHVAPLFQGGEGPGCVRPMWFCYATLCVDADGQHRPTLRDVPTSRSIPKPQMMFWQRLLPFERT